MIRDLMQIAIHLAGAVLIELPLAGSAADISVYSAGAVKAALSQVAQTYEKATGHHIAVEYAPVGTMMRRLSEGAQQDVVVLSMDVMGDAERDARGATPFRRLPCE